MDPNVTLTTIRDLVAAVRYIRSHGGQPPLGLSQDLAKAVRDLDVWLSLGGFKPDAWNSRNI